MSEKPAALDADQASGQESDESWFDELLADLGDRASATLAELQAQDPFSIDVADRIPYLQGLVLDWLYEVREQLNPVSRAAIDTWHEQKREQYRMIREAAERASVAFQQALPPNWQDPEIEFPSLGELEELQLLQGLPLAWVPPSEVLRRLLGLSTLEERLVLIEDQSGPILRSCEAELQRLTAPLLKEWISSAEEVVTCLKAGHIRAGQALAAVALDSAVSEFITKSYKHAVSQTVNGKSTPPGSLPTSFPTWLDVDYPRALMVMYGLWGAHKKYWVRKGDEIPAIFSRHATVHSMSSRQYSLSNALIAVMHLVSLLCVLDEMMSTEIGNPSERPPAD